MMNTSQDDPDWEAIARNLWYCIDGGDDDLLQMYCMEYHDLFDEDEDEEYMPDESMIE